MTQKRQLYTRNKTIFSIGFFISILIITLNNCENLSANGQFNDDSIPTPDYTVKLPIGMNIHSLNYYTPAPIFNDVMTSASEMLTYYTDESGSPWDSGMIGEIERDINGYPTSLPQNTSDGHESCIRFLINNYTQGKFRLFYDGTGTLEVAGGGSLGSDDEGYYIELNGTGGHTWVNITESTPGNYIRNIRIIPDEYDPDNVPTFIEEFTRGLAPFHALRFMDWTRTNASAQVDWDDRITKDYYTQGSSRGISFDYAIELCNQLETDAWVCVPHMASDDYIRNLARLWRDNLDSGLKIYLEYSNEVWNWGFVQSRWILKNGIYGDYPEPVDSYVTKALIAIEENGGDYPEKDAYMMARVFSLWEEEFAASMSSRVVRVATGQHAVASRSERIVKYLFDDTAAFGSIGCDALSVGGYFTFSEESHNNWQDLGSNLSMNKIYADTYENFLATAKEWTEKSAAVAKEYDIDYYVYEGGQHMQPWNQQEWNYNPKLWDFQIHSHMYDLYFNNFAIHADPETNCTLFMAFSYIGLREHRYGSWGHLETLDQVGSSYSDAPKYRALLDANSP